MREVKIENDMLIWENRHLIRCGFQNKPCSQSCMRFREGEDWYGCIDSMGIVKFGTKVAEQD